MLIQTDNKLPGRRVLVTRPAHQADNFATLLSQAGAIAHRLACIEIEWVDNLPDRQLEAALQADVLIFTSSNAVVGLTRLRSAALFDYAKPTIAAIGKATANTLSANSINVDVLPAIAGGSEQLLELLFQAPLTKQTITIVRGDSGRERLRDDLTQAGASVQYLEVYRRSLPLISADAARQIFSSAAPDIISITSDLGLNNLYQLLPVDTHSLLLKTPLIVNSQRCSRLARTLGFSSDIVVASPPGDEGQLLALRNLLKLPG